VTVDALEGDARNSRATFLSLLVRPSHSSHQCLAFGEPNAAKLIGSWKVQVVMYRILVIESSLSVLDKPRRFVDALPCVALRRYDRIEPSRNVQVERKQKSEADAGAE